MLLTSSSSRPPSTRLALPPGRCARRPARGGACAAASDDAEAWLSRWKKRVSEARLLSLLFPAHAASLTGRLGCRARRLRPPRRRPRMASTQGPLFATFLWAASRLQPTASPCSFYVTPWSRLEWSCMPQRQKRRPRPGLSQSLCASSRESRRTTGARCASLALPLERWLPRCSPSGTQTEWTACSCCPRPSTCVPAWSARWEASEGWLCGVLRRAHLPVRAGTLRPDAFCRASQSWTGATLISLRSLTSTRTARIHSSAAARMWRTEARMDLRPRRRA